MAQIHFSININKAMEEVIQKFIGQVDQRVLDCWGNDPHGENRDDMINQIGFDPANMVEVFNGFMEWLKNGEQFRR